MPSDRRAATAEWVLSRPHYRFNRFDLKGIPRGKRGRALEFQIKQWSPYAATGRFVHWDREHALVWMWDAQRVASAMEEQGLRPGRVPVIPESLLHPSHAGGIHLHACLDGFEGQVWEDGALASSRWWPTLPGAAQWLAFQRDAGVAPEHQVIEVPVPLEAPMKPRPWARDQGVNERAAGAARHEPAAVAAAAALLAVATLWYGASLVKLQQARAQSERELAALLQSAQPMALARSKAFDELDRIQALRLLGPQSDPLGLLAKVAEKLSATGAVFREWDYQNGKLKLTIAASGDRPSSDYVRTLLMPGILENVQASSGEAGNLVLTMDVIPSGQLVSESPPPQGRSAK